jgi:hypothetical protein
MNNRAIERTTDFGLHSFPALVDFQRDVLESLQKLTELNLAALKATVNEAQSAVSSWQFSLTPFAGAALSQQQFVERALSYAHHVEDIDRQFQAALIKAGEALRDQYADAWTRFNSNMGNGAPFGADAAVGAMQSVIATIAKAVGETPEYVKRTTGAGSTDRTAVTDIA